MRIKENENYGWNIIFRPLANHLIYTYRAGYYYRKNADEFIVYHIDPDEKNDIENVLAKEII